MSVDARRYEACGRSKQVIGTFDLVDTSHLAGHEGVGREIESTPRFLNL